MYIGAYELTIMYFGLTNSPAIFQTMINDLFCNMINQGSTATFIDNIIVAMETEEKHDEIMEKVLKQLKENNPFIKPEKCWWKVKEMKFLGVVIEPKGVEI